MNSATGQRPELATVGSRFGAELIDEAILVAMFVVLAGILGVAAPDGGSAPPIVAIPILLVFLGLFFAWHPIWHIKRGATPGKLALGIAVVRADNYGPIGPGQAFGRWLFPLAWWWIPCIGPIIHLFATFSATQDHLNRTWMDKVAGTLVVKATRPVVAGAAPVGMQPGGSGMPTAAPVGAAQFPAAMPQVPWKSDEWWAPQDSQPSSVPAAMSGPGAAPAGPEVVPVVPLHPMVERASQPPSYGTSPDLTETVDAAMLGRLAKRDPAYHLSFSTGQEAVLTTGQLLVGREPSPAGVGGGANPQLVAVDDPERLTSRNHLLFTVSDGHLLVEDLGSANGSAVLAVDGSRSPIRPGSSIDVSIGAVVRFGGCEVHISRQ